MEEWRVIRSECPYVIWQMYEMPTYRQVTDDVEKPEAVQLEKR